jgi:hypothetical protein
MHVMNRITGHMHLSIAMRKVVCLEINKFGLEIPLAIVSSK